MHIYEDLGVRRIINARSFSTKSGGSALSGPVLDAMSEASESCVHMAELQEAASRIIAEATVAEAGMVTSGASAALTLASAACLAGFDVSRMSRLPDTTGMKNEIIVHRSHRNDYDHALRAAGAQLVEVGYSYYTFPHEIESVIGPSTVAFFYLAGGEGSCVPLAQFAEIAHKHRLPVIVDAAAELPPRSNLKAFIAAGADLVAFSGGKHLRGPQSTGILCGQRDLILSAMLQHQDMDVFPETWPLRQLIADGLLAGPPHHGIGRGFKVGKEEIAGLLTALQRYSTRDLEIEEQLWMTDLETVLSKIGDIPGVLSYVQADARDVPHAHIDIDPKLTKLDANAVIRALHEGEPSISVFERWANSGKIVIMPEALQPGEAQIIAQRLKEILTNAKAT
jgi:D-glucosaminate-6-phosphate ammonia-lyase